MASHASESQSSGLLSRLEMGSMVKEELIDSPDHRHEAHQQQIGAHNHLLVNNNNIFHLANDTVNNGNNDDNNNLHICTTLLDSTAVRNGSPLVTCDSSSATPTTSSPLTKTEPAIQHTAIITCEKGYEAGQILETLRSKEDKGKISGERRKCTGDDLVIFRVPASSSSSSSSTPPQTQVTQKNDILPEMKIEIANHSSADLQTSLPLPPPPPSSLPLFSSLCVKKDSSPVLIFQTNSTLNPKEESKSQLNPPFDNQKRTKTALVLTPTATSPTSSCSPSATHTPTLPAVDSIRPAEHLPAERDRWLTNEEIYALLTAYSRHADWLTNEVVHRPRSGTLLLYSRKGVRYRRDGYCWKKRKDGKTTREDHMKLKVHGLELIYGCYVHSALLRSFHRRCYWLLSNPDIVLVHYLNAPAQNGAASGGAESSGKSEEKPSKSKCSNSGSGSGSATSTSQSTEHCSISSVLTELVTTSALRTHGGGRDWTQHDLIEELKPMCE